MKKAKKRMSLLVTLLCAFVLVLSLGIISACGGSESASAGNGAWYYGTEIPANELGQEGDYYLNTKTLASYKKTAGVWMAAVESGEVGSWFYGIGAPLESTGAENDFYLDTKSGNLYRRSAEGWGTPVLQLFGQNGCIWFSGKGDPDHTDADLTPAVMGDFYLDQNGFNVYQFVNGKWESLGTLKGGTGDTGATGPQGPQGATGPEGEKGEKGDPGKDGVQLYYGDGAPEKNEELKAKAKDGDLYVGQFDGLDGNPAGTRLYKLVGDKWIVLMESMESDAVINIYSRAQLDAFADSVAGGTTYKGKTVHLKTDIDFDETSRIALAAAMEADGWTPIGSKAFPFEGLFDGEGHTIYNFTAKTTDDAKAVGFFGYIKNAVVEHLHFVGVEVTASGAGAVAGVVAAQAEGDVTFRDVTVEGACKAQDDAKAGGLVGRLETGDGETKVTVEGSSFQAEAVEGVGGSDPTGFVGDNGAIPEKNITVTDSSVTDENGAGTEWDKEGHKKTVYAVGTFEELAAVFGEVADTSAVKIVLTEDLDTAAIAPTAERMAYSGQDPMFGAYYFQSFAGELDGAEHSITFKTNDRTNLSRNDKCGTLFKEIAGGAYIHDITFSVDSPSSQAWGAGSKLIGGLIATAATASTAEDVITIEKVTMTGSANNIRTAFINRCGIASNGVAATVNFIDCTNDIRIQYGSADGAGVDGAGEVGAFMALPNNWSVNFTNCVNKQDVVCGTMSRGSNTVGGFVANSGNSKLTFVNCRNEGNISLMHNHNGTSAEANPGIGGFIGKVTGSTAVVFENCVNLGSVTSRQTRFSLGSAVRSDNRISVGGFVGRADAGSITFVNKNVNGNESGHVAGKGDMCCTDFTVGDIRAGGFIGYTAATVSFGGIVINTGDIVNVETKAVSLSDEYYDYPVNIYAGGLIGQTDGKVTFEADCNYSNLAGAEVGYALKNPMKAYFGGIIGYVAKGTVTVTEGAAGSNSASTFNVTNTGESEPATTVGSFAGCAASSALTEESLAAFTDNGSVEKKIGQTA